MSFDPVKYLEGTNPESSITDNEVRFLFELGRMYFPTNGVMLELGVHHGRSACLLAYIAAIHRGWYYGIDHFRCDRSSYVEAIGYLSERGLFGIAQIIQGSTEDVIWNKPIHFLHIDAGHTDPWVGNDVSKYVPHIVKDGIVAFDDYEKEYPAIIYHADNTCKNRNWEDLGLVEGMKCFRRLYV
jgi:predicted O-methyltransferase YrrM